MNAYKVLQIIDVSIVRRIIAVFLPAVHLLVDRPHLEVFGLSLPDSLAKTVNMVNEILLKSIVDELS